LNIVFFQSSEGHQTEEEVEAEGSRSEDARKRIFSKELRHMMFGLGDDQNPYTESVDLIEDLVIEYIAEMVKIKLNNKILLQ
jgi:transcription initiation factor TFIID subunit 13